MIGVVICGLGGPGYLGAPRRSRKIVPLTFNRITIILYE